MALEWRNLTYTVPVGRGKKKTTKTILDRLSGVAPPGHLLAIMGPTGVSWRRRFWWRQHLLAAMFVDAVINSGKWQHLSALSM